MSIVWKHVLSSSNNQIAVPAGSEFLYAREQYGQICVWFRCDPERPKEQRTLKVRGTGQPDARGHYLGSAHLESDSLIFHVFEVS